MLYKTGDRLICKKSINTRCLEMCNPNFDIQTGDEYIVTDIDDYPVDNSSHWYELMSVKDKSIVLSAWNDEGHMIIDDSFDKCN